MRIGIVDLGLSNAGSVVNMFRKCDVDPVVVTDSADLVGCQRIVLSGVGSFDSGMSRIKSGGWLETLNGLRTSPDVKILGICLGMQLMAKRSEEGLSSGLAWFNAEVQRLSPHPESGLRVPHMGWNQLEIQRPNPYLRPGVKGERFYFVHSYHVVCKDPSDCVATVDHGQRVTAAISRGNLYGVQFHPEKSHHFGMAFLKKFADS